MNCWGYDKRFLPRIRGTIKCCLKCFLLKRAAIVLGIGVIFPVLVTAGWFGKEKAESEDRLAAQVSPAIEWRSNVQGHAGPKILTIAPIGHVQDTGETRAITVTFDRPMVALQALPKEEVKGPLNVNPPLKGKYRWLGTSTLVFTPEKPFETATRYTATIPAGTSAKDGTRLENDFKWTFDTVRPQFVRSDPYHRSKFVDLKPPFFLSFNQEMSAARANGHIVLKGRPTPEDKLFQHHIEPYKDEDYAEEFPIQVRHVTDEEYKRHRWFAKDASLCLVITPKKALKREYTYTLILSEGLPAESGNLGLLKDRHLQFKTYNHFRILGVQQTIHPAEGLRITFSNPVMIKDAAKSLAIEPPLSIPEHYLKHTYHTHEMTFSLGFSPQQTYSVRISPPLKDKFNQKLKREWLGAINVTSYVPGLKMPTGNITVEAKLKPRLPVEAINMKTVEKLLLPAAPEKAIPLLLQPNLYWRNNTWLGGEGISPDIWNIQGKLNKGSVIPLDLDESLGPDGRGFVFVNLKPKEADPRIESYPLSKFNSRTKYIRKAFVQVTNLGITAKCSPENNLIWVTYLGTGRAVMEAKVELRNDKGELLWQGTTDKKGLAVSPGWALLNDTLRPNAYTNPRVWIVASKNSDTAMVASNWGTGIYPYRFGLPYVSRQIYPEYSGHVYTERGLYRAGETVYIKGLFRRKRKGDWVISDIKLVELKIKNSRGEEVLKKELPVSSYGSFHTKFDLGKTAVTGGYSISVREPGQDTAKSKPQSKVPEKNKLQFNGSFKVEAFIPAKFEITSRLSRESYIYGDEAEGTVRGWYLFGAPMKEAGVAWKARLWETYFAPKGHPGYAFGPRRHLMAYKGTSSRSILLASGKGKLGKTGYSQVRFPLEAKTLLGSMSLRLEGTVTDEDRQSISGRKTAIVHAGEFYVGLRPSTTFADNKKPLEISVIAADSEGNLLEGKPVKLMVIRREWHSVRKAGIRGRTSWVTEKKEIEEKKFSIKTKAGPVTVSFFPEKAGFYILHAESKDERSRRIYSDTYFYVTGTDYVAWARSDDDKIELVADRTSYKPGDVARVMVKSPYESALALVSLEREGIMHHFTTSLNGSADVVEIPLEERFVPNIFVSVVLLKGRTATGKFSEKGEDIGKPSFKIGYVNLPVDPGTRRLSVKVNPDKKDYRPGGKVSVNVSVKDHKGLPRESEFSIAVVDRGILDLIGYTTPDSFNSFYGGRPLSVETVESRLHVVGQRNYGEKGENRGGGGRAVPPGLLADADLRGIFKATAFWKADAVTDRQGKAAVEFELPDNLTTFKLMVTVNTKDSNFGAGDNELVVKQPLMLKPSLPRFARLGDRFEGGVVVHNHTGKDGQVLIEADSTGITRQGTGTKETAVNDGSAREVTFDYSADKLGKATMRFAAKLGSERDGLHLNVPVILPRITEAVALFENTTSKAEQPLKIPADIYPEIGGLQLEAASTALIGLKEGIRYLQKFPHECLEQKLSKVLPFLLAGDLLEAFGLSELEGKKKQEVVNDILNELPSFQLSGGGFTYWPGSGFPSEYITAYTVFFLHAAKKDGFDVDQKMVDRANSFLRQVLRRRDAQLWNYPYRRNAQLCTKAFIVYALSLWNVRETGYITRLYNDRFQIPVFGKAMLLKAIRHTRMSRSMEDDLVRDMFNSIKQDSTRAHFEEQDPAGLDWIFYSSVRTSAYVLQAMLETGHEFPQGPRVIRWLMDERKNGRWRSTQENLYVFYALAEYFKRYESEEPDFTATIKLGGREALRYLFQGRSIEARQVNVPWTDLPMGQEITAAMEKEGSGRFYYGLRMVYAPKGPLPPREEGLQIKREITLANGDPLPKELKVGAKLRVTLTVTTPFDRTYIAVEDPLPAGFQVVNTGFRTTSSEDVKTLQDAQSKTRRWWGSFNHREFYDDRVVIYADYLTHGSHTASYLVNAITRGDFSLPPARAEGMYTPEVFARTEEKRIEIR